VLARRSALIGATALLAASTSLLLPTGPASAQSGVLTQATPKIMRTIGSVVPTENRLPLLGGAPVGLPLQYGGGAVEVTNTSFAIFWEPAGHTSAPGYQTLIKRWFADVGGSALFNTTTQYYQGSNQHIQNVSTFGGSYVDTAPFPAGGITDAALQAEVRKVVAAQGWPTGVGNEVFVYSGPGGEIVSSYCAYHSYITINGQTVAYADEPYGGQSGCTVPASPNGNPAADSAINTTSHEQWESITDPHTGDGWVAPDGDEGSDQCNFEFGTQDSSGADVHLHGNPYIVQQEWSNANGFGLLGCTMG
jgi:hypothetical protein